MTLPVCVLSSAIRSQAKAIASVHALKKTVVSFSDYRIYVAGSLCIMGLSLFSAMPVPGAIAHQPIPLAHAPMNNDLQSNAQWLDVPSAFIPPKDLGLPDRREPGGTR